eukprot:scaffold70438_cov23-Tisochrysis_lutea.AAC.1
MQEHVPLLATCDAQRGVAPLAAGAPPKPLPQRRILRRQRHRFGREASLHEELSITPTRVTRSSVEAAVEPNGRFLCSEQRVSRMWRGRRTIQLPVRSPSLWPRSPCRELLSAVEREGAEQAGEAWREPTSSPRPLRIDQHEPPASQQRRRSERRAIRPPTAISEAALSTHNLTPRIPCRRGEGARGSQPPLVGFFLASSSRLWWPKRREKERTSLEKWKKVDVHERRAERARRWARGKSGEGEG